MDLKTGAVDPWFGHHCKDTPVVPDFKILVQKALGLKQPTKKEEGK